jgi:hypothetical protein
VNTRDTAAATTTSRARVATAITTNVCEAGKDLDLFMESGSRNPSERPRDETKRRERCS